MQVALQTPTWHVLKHEKPMLLIGAVTQQPNQVRRVQPTQQVNLHSSYQKLKLMAMEFLNQRSTIKTDLNPELPLALAALAVENLDGRQGAVGQRGSVDHPEPPFADDVVLFKPLSGNLQLSISENLPALPFDPAVDTLHLFSINQNPEPVSKYP